MTALILDVLGTEDYSIETKSAASAQANKSYYFDERGLKPIGDRYCLRRDIEKLAIAPFNAARSLKNGSRRDRSIPFSILLAFNNGYSDVHIRVVQEFFYCCFSTRLYCINQALFFCWPYAHGDECLLFYFCRSGIVFL